MCGCAGAARRDGGRGAVAAVPFLIWQLKGSTFLIWQVVATVDELLAEGFLYSTIDDDHIKVT